MEHIGSGILKRTLIWKHIINKFNCQYLWDIKQLSTPFNYKKNIWWYLVYFLYICSENDDDQYTLQEKFKVHNQIAYK